MPKQPTVGDTPEHTWMVEFLDRCFPESGGRTNADLQLSMAMCKAEPKCAQVAMQWLAQDIRSRRASGPEADFSRFALGVLFMSYVAVAIAEGRCGESEIPAELKTPIKWNPEIMACANALGPMDLD